MNKKINKKNLRTSTYDNYLSSLSAKEKKKFEEEYRGLVLSELILAIMEQDRISVRKLAKAAGISPTVIQGIRSGKRNNVSIQSFFKILHVLGYSLIAERGKNRIPLGF